MNEELIVLGKIEIIELIKEKYPDSHVELYIDYDDKGVAYNDQIIAEVNVNMKS